MKSKTMQRWRVRSWLVLCLLVGGCSGEQSEQPTVAPVTSSPLNDASRDKRSLTPAESALPEVVTPVEELVSANHNPAGVSEPTEHAPANALAWDGMEQRRFATAGDGPVLFSFQVTNASSEAVTIEKINTSCGCTTADTKELPFSLAPGTAENIQISMNIAGKIGRVTKSIFVQTDHGNSTLLVTSEVVPKTTDESAEGGSNGEPISSGTREQNLALAQSDRQAVFKGSCGECHTRYAEDRFGYNLYLAACAICHDAKHRASMVPDLRTVGLQDAAYWREHITDGIDGTLMPAFAKENRGILSTEQIESLVKFLVETPLEGKVPRR